MLPGNHNTLKTLLPILFTLILCSNAFGAPTVVSSYNWRIYQNASGDPTTAYAAENAAGTLSANSNIIRIRVVLSASTNFTINNLQVEYSTNNSTFTALGPSNAWNWATALGGTDGGTLSTVLITDESPSKGIYCKSSNNSPNIVVTTNTEYDFEIQPTSTVVPSTLYYFEVYATNASIVLGSGKTHPQVNTTITPIVINSTISGKSTINGSSIIH